jgi:hypothetical protein
MNKQIVITKFENVHSLPSGVIEAHRLSETLIPGEALEQVAEVTKDHKERNTGAYTLCTFQNLEKATQENLERIHGIVLDFDSGHSSFGLVKGQAISAKSYG